MIQTIVGLSGAILVLLGICIKLWSDVQVLKIWKNEHIEIHKEAHQDRKETDTKIFEKLDTLLSLISEVVGNCKGKSKC